MSGDDGQVVTALVLVAVVGVVALFVFGIVDLGRATDEASRAQTAADAAALGGATEIRRQLLSAQPRHYDTRDEWLSLLRCGLGIEGADDFALRNGARVSSYCYRPDADRVEVAVELLDPGVGDDGPATRAAVASIGLGFRGCAWTDDPIPPVLPLPPVPPLPPLPPGLPPLPELPPLDLGPSYPPGTTLTCGDQTFRYVIDDDGGMLLVPPNRLTVQLRPRLVE